MKIQINGILDLKDKNYLSKFLIEIGRTIKTHEVNDLLIEQTEDEDNDSSGWREVSLNFKFKNGKE